MHNTGCKSDMYVETVDDALDVVENHLGKTQSYYVDSKGEIKSKILVSNSNPNKVARFDIDILEKHVMEEGVHINLETYREPFGTKGVKRPIQNIHLKWRK